MRHSAVGKQHATNLRFHFHLRPMTEVAPWHDADGSNPHLGWFGLSDGWYWIEAGSAELFRYSQPLVDKWRREHNQAPWLDALPYVDYQVARLWEDIIEILPDALEPIPPRLTCLLEPPRRWMSWSRAAQQTVEQTLPNNEGWDLLDTAAGWWWARRLNTSHLQAGPQITLWSDGNDVHLHWDNRDCILDDLPAWAATVGECAVPVEDFVAEVNSFNGRFITRMHDRIAIAQTAWERPDVALDSGLDEEQSARSRWLSRSLLAVDERAPTDWSEVIRAVARIEALPGFPSERILRLS